MHWCWRTAAGITAGIGFTGLAALMLGDNIISFAVAIHTTAVFVAAGVAALLPESSHHTSETRCRKCGYILRGITEPRCPECGERI